jgi:nucleoid-associated protein YgaU
MGTVTKLLLLVVMAGLVVGIVVWDQATSTGTSASASSSATGGEEPGTTGPGIVDTLKGVKDKAGRAIEDLDIKRRAEETFGKLDIKRRAGEIFNKIGDAVDTVSGGKTTKAEPRETPRRPGPAGAGREHVVRKGETLWSIAKHYYGNGAHADRIKAANRETLGKSRHLRIGTRLWIPGAPATAAPEPVRETRRDPAPRGGPRTYRVRRGDTLWRIAERELGDGMKWKPLYEANRDLLVKPSDLKVGLVIRLPEN